MTKFFLLLSFSLLIISCGSETAKCKYGEPVAIFSDETPDVIKRSFTGNGQTAIEEASFKNGMSVEIQQSGCDDILQVFQFRVERPSEGEPNWFLVAGEQFNYIGNLSEKLEPLLMWGTVINQNAGGFKYGLPLEVDQGFFIKIDKIESGKNAILTVELSENLYPSNF